MSIVEDTKTEIDNLSEKVNEWLSFCKIKYSPDPPGCIILYGKYSIEPTDKESFDKLRSYLIKEYTRITSKVEVLLNEEPDKKKNSFKIYTAYLFNILNNDAHLYEKSLEEIYNKCNKDLEHLKSLLENIYTSSSDIVIVPDTSYLLNFPDIEKWNFNNLKKFTIVIVPIVLNEIDEKKEFHRNSEVNDKARKLVNIFKSLRMRANEDNVSVVLKDKIYIKFLAIEPNFNKVFDTLDPKVPDDRFIASYLEVIRSFCNSNCYAIADDFNLLNKLFHYRLPILDVTNYDKIS